MADTTEPDDPTLCTNPDASGESCGGSFDHKSSPGLCAMCYMATKDAARAEAMKVCCAFRLEMLLLIFFPSRTGPSVLDVAPNSSYLKVLVADLA
jgi:hypothetical protein